MIVKKIATSPKSPPKSKAANVRALADYIAGPRAWITSRYGSHALADGARPGCGMAAESVDTSSVVAGFDFRSAKFPEEKPVDTPALVAGFGGQTRGLPPADRTATPAARR